MTKFEVCSPEYTKKQYKNTTNLDTRISLHQRFSTNPYGWMAWVFDQFDMPPQCSLIEIGCGPADLWLENLERIPSGWQLLLTDFSEGMLTKAKARLGHDKRFRFEHLDAGKTPWQLDDGRFDAVIANHMLYHVPNRPAAIAEIHRILKSGGQFYATTIGQRHMREIKALIGEIARQENPWDSPTATFTLENGAEQLARFFPHIRMSRYLDALEITEAAPLVEYIYSGWVDASIAAPAELEGRILAKMEANNGVFNVFKDSGIFIMHKG